MILLGHHPATQLILGVGIAAVVMAFWLNSNGLTVILA